MVSPETLVALLGGEGVASVIAAWAALKASTNSKQLRANHGTSVADAVSRIETKVDGVAAKQTAMEATQRSQGHELAAANDRLAHLERSLTGVQSDLREERRERRTEFRDLADEVEHSFQIHNRKE